MVTSAEVDLEVFLAIKLHNFINYSLPEIATCSLCVSSETQARSLDARYNMFLDCKIASRAFSRTGLVRNKSRPLM